MSNKRFLWGIVIVILIGVGACFGVQWVTKTGLFRVPGIVKYDDSLTDEEKKKLAEIFTEQIDLDKDVEISADYRLVKPTSENEYIYNIYIPVTDFYSSDNNINVTEAANLFVDAYQSETTFTMAPFDELDFKQKLLSINDKYYLDDLNEGAAYRIIKFDSEKFTDEIQPLLNGKIGVKAPEKSEILTFAQTGVTALSRGMNEKLYQVGDAEYFAEQIKDYLASFDITHTSNESSFSELASAHNICSDVRFIDTLTAIGLDVVELTGNHNMDCGAVAAEETIDLYGEKGIKTVGGGKNATEAAVPLQLSNKGTNITMLAYNQSTGGATTGDLPGANQYYEANASAEIKAAKERGDFVIVDVQYYECSAYASEYEDPICDYANSSAGDQVGFFRHLIDLGADVVVGTSAHQPQTYELYGDGVIYYGLGNLFFDQIWWPGTTRSLVLAHYFKDGKLLQTKVVPTAYGESMQTALMDDPQWYLDRLIKVRP
ncbi:CapA family protein [Candidatus Saccharibacteria bacterium]|nr:CapA family protein [Candidatus Saccharibacteria bacterium]